MGEDCKKEMRIVVVFNAQTDFPKIGSTSPSIRVKRKGTLEAGRRGEPCGE